jgi:hypothetical protein
MLLRLVRSRRVPPQDVLPAARDGGRQAEGNPMGGESVERVTAWRLLLPRREEVEGRGGVLRVRRGRSH